MPRSRASNLHRRHWSSGLGDCPRAGLAWQRGSDENANGLLRRYFPKSTDLSVHGFEDLERVGAELDARPRNTLGRGTPADRFAGAALGGT